MREKLQGEGRRVHSVQGGKSKRLLVKAEAKALNGNNACNYRSYTFFVIVTVA
jgi:hypothetical protein